MTETTALGACYLAGLAVGFWSGLDEIKSQWQVDRTFTPQASIEEVAEKKTGWKDAVERCLSR